MCDRWLIKLIRLSLKWFIRCSHACIAHAAVEKHFGHERKKRTKTKPNYTSQIFQFYCFTLRQQMIISNGFVIFCVCVCCCRRLLFSCKFLHSTETNYPHFSFLFKQRGRWNPQQQQRPCGNHSIYFRRPLQSIQQKSMCCMKTTIYFVHLSYARVTFQDGTNKK